ncbi:MAG: hypothetical protein ACXW30_00535 [Micavibrio sp.]
MRKHLAKTFSILLFLFSYFVTIEAKADSIRFISNMLADSLREEHDFPREEAKKFSRCVEDYIKPRITGQQQEALEELQWDIAEHKTISIATEVSLEKSGFSLLGASAQDYCTTLFYPRVK